MLKYIFSVLCVTYYIECQTELGDPCPLPKGDVGTCKIRYECEFARKMLKGMAKPQISTCNYDYRNGLTKPISVYCCPNKDLFHITGALQKYFYVTEDGVMRSKNMTCRYDGDQPLTCCENLPDYSPSVDSNQCPPLTLPRLNKAPSPVEKLAIDKCLDTRRYLYKCVWSEKDDTYERKDTCGIPSSRVRIINGKEASIRQFPHMAVLGYQNGISTSDVDIHWLGGGSLISDKFILTAGHILNSHEHGKVRYALLGALNKTELRSGALYNIVKRIGHPMYHPTSQMYDIALLELHRQVKLSEFIRPACLPVPGIDMTSEFEVAGWGKTETGESSDLLLTTAPLAMDTKEGAEMNENIVELVNESKCIALKSSRFNWNPDLMLCASGKLRNGRATDSCQGDSGGPMMKRIDLGNTKHPCTYVVVGIVSFGPTCATGAAVYTKVAPYLEWIVRTVWPDDYNKI